MLYFIVHYNLIDMNSMMGTLMGLYSYCTVQCCCGGGRSGILAQSSRHCIKFSTTTTNTCSRIAIAEVGAQKQIANMEIAETYISDTLQIHGQSTLPEQPYCRAILAIMQLIVFPSSAGSTNGKRRGRRSPH